MPLQRLNYIGSKYQLLDWILTSIKEKTGWASFSGRRIGDLFAGTGIVSHTFRSLGATVLSNDRELFSSIITQAFTVSTYTDRCKQLIEQFQEEAKTATTVGYITRHYSPYEGQERMFFTVRNAQSIDFLRQRIEEIRPTVTPQEYIFLLASLLVSADAVSNVPAVYGCYLKKFKAKANKPLVLTPVHTEATVPPSGSQTMNLDVLDPRLLTTVDANLIYLDPPYNERQYSKNYFPLNMIAKDPVALQAEAPLKGKTGIPTDCFLSPLCQKKTVQASLETLFRELKAEWIVMSYNSESLVAKDTVLEIMKKYGTASVVEREYKRFKSFEYNEDKEIKEYLFFLQKSTMKK